MSGTFLFRHFSICCILFLFLFFFKGTPVHTHTYTHIYKRHFYLNKTGFFFPAAQAFIFYNSLLIFTAYLFTDRLKLLLYIIKNIQITTTINYYRTHDWLLWLFMHTAQPFYQHCPLEKIKPIFLFGLSGVSWQYITDVYRYKKDHQSFDGFHIILRIDFTVEHTNSMILILKHSVSLKCIRIMWKKI